MQILNIDAMSDTSDAPMYEAHMLSDMMESPDNVVWEEVSLYAQEWQLPLLMKYPNRINWKLMDYFKKKHSPYDEWYGLQKFDPWMTPLLIQNPEKIDWYHISVFAEEKMLPLFLAHPDRIDWEQIYSMRDDEPWLLPLLIQNPDKIWWDIKTFNSPILHPRYGETTIEPADKTLNATKNLDVALEKLSLS